MDLSKTKKIYMIGVKGVGMAMLAQFFAGNGIEVIGSDTVEKFMTDEPLLRAGVKIIENFDTGNIPKDANLIVYSTAYNAERNVEVAAALGGKIRTLTYAQALGEVFNQKYGIAVVGSHGKTTTTAWLGFVLDRAGIKPNVMVGSIVPQFNGPSLVSKSDLLIIEADEYQNKLQYFNPRAILLNNIDYDHPDFFPTPEEYQNVFIEFIKRLPAKGFLVTNFDDPIIRKVANVNCRGRVISYAIDEQADYVAYDLKSLNGEQYFKVKVNNNLSSWSGAERSDRISTLNRQTRDSIDPTKASGLQNDTSFLGDFKIKLLGKHNVSNALAVIAAAIELEAPLSAIRQHLAEFTGTARRMQKLGEYNGAQIYDDYAHHPSEIKATLSGFRQLYPKNKLTVLFHPHTFTRTKALLDDFAKSFSDADQVVVLDIYGSAREAQGGVHAKDLIQKIIADGHHDVKYIPSLKEAEEYLRKNAERGEVVVLMGAGDVFRIGENLLK
jgi:UDP-N-acetylmuramate--alanine ligase